MGAVNEDQAQAWKPTVCGRRITGSRSDVMMRYYDLRKNWPKVQRHLHNPRVTKTLARDFNKFTYGRWRQRFPSDHGRVPFDFESCDWWIQHRGPKPRFWKYVKHSACHWLVNFALELAQLVEPKRKWRIITSDKHSTVWDGEGRLFDFNFQALGIDPGECFKLANDQELALGQHLTVYMAEHWKRL
jgi:hypothetical protein